MRLPHDEAGSGPAVVLLHAGVADRREWAEHLEPLAAAGYRAIAPDLPGFGDAPMPAAFEEWIDILETLDALGVQRAVLVGNSFGGAMALRVATVAPERVRGLMLVSAGPPGLEPSPELSSVWAAERAALERGDVEAALHVVVDAWLGPDASPEARERVRDMQRHTYEVQGDAEPEEVEDPLDEHPERLAELRTPTLIVAGELDFVDYREGARAMADAIPGAAHQELPSLGHLFPLERPHEFRTRLIAFLRSLDPDAGLSRPGADSPRA